MGHVSTGSESRGLLRALDLYLAEKKETANEPKQEIQGAPGELCTSEQTTLAAERGEMAGHPPQTQISRRHRIREQPSTRRQCQT